MKKLIAISLITLLGLPLCLSFFASYYARHQLAQNLARNIHIERIDFEHGWFTSNAEIDLRITPGNSQVKTQNKIEHGPLIWSALFSRFSRVFSLYKIETKFALHTSNEITTEDHYNGQALTFISYRGQSSPQITHPGLNMSLLNRQLFADMPVVSSNIHSDGRITTRISGNQLEINDIAQSVYLTQPEFNLALNPAYSLPESLELSASTVSAQTARGKLKLDTLNLMSAVNRENNRYTLVAGFNAQLLQFEQALVTDCELTIQIDNLDQALIDYLAAHNGDISQSIINNQWLGLLSHVSELIRLISKHPLEIAFNLAAIHQNNPVSADFSGRILTGSGSNLNPFSLLENIALSLNASLPVSLIEQLGQSDWTHFFHVINQKGLITQRNGRYYAKIKFENSKMSLARRLE